MTGYLLAFSGEAAGTVIQPHKRANRKAGKKQVDVIVSIKVAHSHSTPTGMRGRSQIPSAVLKTTSSVVEPQLPRRPLEHHVDVSVAVYVSQSEPYGTTWNIVDFTLEICFSIVEANGKGPRVKGVKDARVAGYSVSNKNVYVSVRVQVCHPTISRWHITQHYLPAAEGAFPVIEQDPVSDERIQVAVAIEVDQLNAPFTAQLLPTIHKRHTQHRTAFELFE
jgi:hypothetical protein